MMRRIIHVCLLLILSVPAFSQITWNNNNGTGSWDDPDNWDPAQVPTETDEVIFDATVTNDDCFIGSAAQCAGITFQGSYTGVVEVADQVELIVWGNFVMPTAANFVVDGTFNVGFLNATNGTINASSADAFTVSSDYGGSPASAQGGFTISGCTFTAPSAVELIITGTIANRTSGSFDANGGTVSFSPRINKNIGSGFTSTNAFHNLNMETTGAGVVTTAINAGGVGVDGTLTIITSGTKNFLLNTGTITVLGDLDVSNNLANNSTASNATGGSGTISLAGTTTQNIIGNVSDNVGGNLPNVIITQGSGGTISLSGRINFGRNLTINSNGAITANTSTLAFQNTVNAASISGTTTTNIALYNLTINKNTAQATDFSITSLSASWVTLSNLLTVTAGTFDTGNKLRFLSTASNTSAQVGPVGGTITGTVLVERFIPGSTGRKWRFLASPVTTTGFISGNWQQAIHITGSGTGGTNCPSLTAHTNGFDATVSNSPSMYTYSESTAAWASVANTSSTNLTPGVGYRVFVRGARSQGCTLIDGTTPTPTPNDVTLTATGTLATGSQVINLSFGTGDGWNLVGNPFQAIIDWDDVGRSGSVSNFYQVFNPTGGIGGAGIYGTYTAGGSGTNGVSRYIAPGHSFWAKCSAGSQTLTIDEADKDVTQSTFTNLFKTSTLQPNDLSIKVIDQNNYSDEVVVSFNALASKCYDNNLDVEKFQFAQGVGNIAIYSSCDANKYAIAAVKPVDLNSNDTFMLHIRVPAATSANYSLAFNGLSAIDAQADVFLVDNFLNTYFNLRNNSIYNFSTIAGNAASQGANRFMVIYGSGLSSLPVKLVNFNATRAGNHSKLNWSTSSELNSKMFVIERSIDGKDYQQIGVIAAKGNSSVLSSYQYNDLSPVNNTINYYRLKTVDKDGKFEYSAVQLVSFESGKSTVELVSNVYPVPAKEELNLVLGEMAEGIITYNIYDVTGTRVVEESNIRGGNIEVTIPVPASLSAGIYILQLTDNAGNSQQIKFTKE